MDINNSTNITNQVAASISKINLNTAKRSYESPKEENSDNVQIKQEDIKLMDKQPVYNKIDVDDIQKYANYMGENLSIDDINYGLMYGRSVIADFCV